MLFCTYVEFQFFLRIGQLHLLCSACWVPFSYTSSFVVAESFAGFYHFTWLKQVVTCWLVLAELHLSIYIYIKYLLFGTYSCWVHSFSKLGLSIMLRSTVSSYLNRYAWFALVYFHQVQLLFWTCSTPQFCEILTSAIFGLCNCWVSQFCQAWTSATVALCVLSSTTASAGMDKRGLLFLPYHDSLRLGWVQLQVLCSTVLADFLEENKAMVCLFTNSLRHGKERIVFFLLLLALPNDLFCCYIIDSPPPTPTPHPHPSSVAF